MSSALTDETDESIPPDEESSPNLASTPVFKDEFESSNDEPPHFCSGNGETLVLHKHLSLFRFKPYETAIKYQVSAFHVKLSDYTLEFNDENKLKILGEGAYGEVSLGRYLGVGVAVKELEHIRFEDAVDILKEIATNDRARSPNIANLVAFNSKEEQSIARLLIEYLEGAELRTVLFDEESDSPEIDSLHKKISTVKQLLSAVQYLHACEPSIIYSDLKPENIMITHDLRVKLCDFGSIWFDGLPEQLDPPDRIDFTQVTTIYPAPEILLYDEDITEKSNVWAASCVALKISIKEWSWPIGENPSKILMKQTLSDGKKTNYRCVPSQLHELLDDGF
ncbi:hypothetical protein QAD02_013156 [Eretmocerus hayati]|uniref:Uncharacterized protein n=1 Tax=Eretmocerus hayati TaxID=131215 RepID=A0ACC2P232_9HYME|nr:hypothetical protein QAD02_013156 [Eretmocerus hayati]